MSAKKKTARPPAQPIGNADVEMRWVDAWNDLYDLASDQLDIRCLLPDGQVVDLETCKGWLQDSAYGGWLIHVESGWVLGRRGIVARRWRP